MNGEDFTNVVESGKLDWTDIRCSSCRRLLFKVALLVGDSPHAETPIVMASVVQIKCPRCGRMQNYPSVVL